MIIELTKVYRIHVNERTRAFKSLKSEAEFYELLEQELELEENPRVVIDKVTHRVYTEAEERELRYTISNQRRKSKKK